jgi:hypothetical protein
MTWHFRDFTNQSYYGDRPRESLDAPVVSGPKHWSKVEALLGDRYYMFEVHPHGLPMQDYFNLDWPRVSYAGNAEYARAIWNICILTATTRSTARWTDKTLTCRSGRWLNACGCTCAKTSPAEIWSYGVGPTVLEGEAAPEDPVGAQGAGRRAPSGAARRGERNSPSPRAWPWRPMAVYVADSRNNRIQKFDAEGNLLLTWGTLGSLDTGNATPGTFNEPWGVAVGPDGAVYVTDTWNHRVQKFDANGGFLTMWGIFGQGETTEAFWGPRGIAVDATGRVYVADTGNKRVAVFDANGVGYGHRLWRQRPASSTSQVGVAVSSDGTVFVADTWNQRVQVFQWDAAKPTATSASGRLWAGTGSRSTTSRSSQSTRKAGVRGRPGATACWCSTSSASS